MKKCLFALVLPLVFPGEVHASPAAPSDSLLHDKISVLWPRYLGYLNLGNDDSILRICSQAEKQAAAQNDLPAKFQAQQLAVNALCIKGDIGLGIATAGHMYEEAKKKKHPLGTALALQALGSTYIYSGQYDQAQKTFSEASPEIEKAGSPLSRIRLALQQAHTAFGQNDPDLMDRHLSHAESLLGKIPSDQQDAYLFHTDSYRILHLALSGQVAQATRKLDSLRNASNDRASEHWLYYLQYFCHISAGETLKALEENDSLLALLQNTGNRHEYLKVLRERALLLEAAGKDSIACEVSRTALDLTDSLNSLRYSKQINALHLAYWVDQMAIDNIAAHNRVLASVISYVIAGLLLGGVLAFLLRRKNRQLETSRLLLDQARKATADSLQSKSMFLSNMSHELRTPLNGIVGFSALLTDPDGTDAETRQMCRDNIRQNSELLLKLVGDIVDFSELKGSRIKFSYQHVEAVALCRSVMETVEKVKQTPARLIFEPNVDRIDLYTDKGRLQQVLINLLINATKFTREGTITLRLDVDPENGEAVFAVEDTGIGIPIEKQARIFERFEKLHEGIQGSGLGLSICQLIVEHMKGRIWIDSRYTAGARFVFTHPLKGGDKNSPE